MSWLYSQALVAEYSADTFSDGEPSAQLSVMPTPHKFSRNDKMMECSSLSRFGLTLRLLTEDHGEAVLTSYLAAFPARTSPLQGEAQGLKESEADCGRSSLGSLARFDRDSSSWRTPQFSLLGGWELFSETWPSVGSMRNGECWERPTLERRTDESESGLLPTPSATEGGPMPELAHEPRMNQRNYSAKTGKHCQITLRRYVETFATPTARDHKSGKFSDQAKAKRDEHSRGKPLSEQVGGQLNPTWVEWLMGWPTGWTGLKPLGMAKFREWQQQHSTYYEEGLERSA